MNINIYIINNTAKWFTKTTKNKNFFFTVFIFLVPNNGIVPEKVSLIKIDILILNNILIYIYIYYLESWSWIYNMQWYWLVSLNDYYNLK